MTAPRLKVGGIVRDDSYDGIARLRIDNYGNLYLDAEDIHAMALMLASPPAVNRAAIAREARAESEARQREEAGRRERERIAAGAAREADLKKLREQFPALADQIVGPALDGTPAWRVFVAHGGGSRMYLEKYLNGGPMHTTERLRAMRFPTQAAAEQQVRSLAPHPYLVEAA